MLISPIFRTYFIILSLNIKYKHLTMKKYHSHLFLLFSVLVLTAFSCHKEDPEPDLVPITTTGANTMGFYLDGIPINITGEYGGFTPKGVTGGIFEGRILYILGGGESHVARLLFIYHLIL